MGPYLKTVTTEINDGDMRATLETVWRVLRWHDPNPAELKIWPGLKRVIDQVEIVSVRLVKAGPVPLVMASKYQ